MEKLKIHFVLSGLKLVTYFSARFERKIELSWVQITNNLFVCTFMLSNRFSRYHDIFMNINSIFHFSEGIIFLWDICFHLLSINRYQIFLSSESVTLTIDIHTYCFTTFSHTKAGIKCRYEYPLVKISLRILDYYEHSFVVYFLAYFKKI